MRNLRIAAIVGAVSAIDCSPYPQWVSGQTYADPGVKVVYNGVVYINKWYNAEMPGSSEWGPWDVVGECSGDSVNQGNYHETTVDCNGVGFWLGAAEYKSEGIKVIYENALYKSKWWTSGDRPGAADESSPWTRIGPCEGTYVQTGDSSGLSESQKETICHCCQGCGKVLNIGVQCMDGVAEEDCYFAWCPKYNIYNPEVCAYETKSYKYAWYPKEIVEGNHNWPSRIFIPYIDGGLAQQPKVTELCRVYDVCHYVLAFIQSVQQPLPTDKCMGAFASVIHYNQGPTFWNETASEAGYFYDELNELRKMGGDITVSFGGAMGIEVADSPLCQSQPDPVLAIKNAYREIIDALKLTHIDFDIEGNAIGIHHRNTGWAWRFEAVKQLTQEMPDLKVWWTLPILPQGLTSDGVAFIHDMMASGVRWDKFNVMTMDYGDNIVCLNDEMHPCEIDAITNLARQFWEVAGGLNLRAKYGWNSIMDVYPYMGSTPMVGVNDITTEIYHVQDAKDSLKVWETQYPIGIISMWSVGRDHPCDHTYVDTGCSSQGVQKEDYEYLKIFSAYKHY